MNGLKILAAVIMIMALAAGASAQMADKVEIRDVTEKYDLGVTRKPSLPFIDFSRLDFSHSYSISYMSGGGYSGAQAFYNGTISYQLANPLTLTLNIGILHDPGVLVGSKSFSENATILPSGWLDWRPSENFRMTIGFETIPAYYNNYGGYYYPGSSRYWRYR